ncbi:hypothetical protein BJV78DRAFT_923854 [Lactifluus subvellereus]|nr:hypothetical protein BJV78DRAFT_923854 [Lactifluus subvellereus]
MASRDVGPERERARSRSGHRDRSAERSRRRDGESEKDKYKRRRDRHRRDTLGRGDDDVADRTGLSGEQPFLVNALGIQPHHPGQGLYAPVAPPVTSTSESVRHQEPYPSTSSAGGASSSYPATSHGTAPAISTTVSVSGLRHREVPQIYGAGTSRAPRIDPMYRPSSTPTGPVLSSWVAPDPSNPSLNSLGLSAPGQDVSGVNSQILLTAPASTLLTARDSVSSWGTADSGQTNGDIFSTLHPLASAPADSGLSASDLLPRPDGQLLGVVRGHSSLLAAYAHFFSQGRSAQIASPRPQFPQAPAQPAFGSPTDRDIDARPRSRHSNHARSRSQTSFVSNRDPSQPSAPQSYTPEDRGFPYAAVPPRHIPIPYVPPRSTTPASRPSSSHPMSMVPPPFPQIPAPQPTTAVSRPPQNIHHPYFYGPSSSQQLQNSSHRTHHQH